MSQSPAGTLLATTSSRSSSARRVAAPILSTATGDRRTDERWWRALSKQSRAERRRCLSLLSRQKLSSSSLNFFSLSRESRKARTRKTTATVYVGRNLHQPGRFFPSAAGKRSTELSRRARSDQITELALRHSLVKPNVGKGREGEGEGATNIYYTI